MPLSRTTLEYQLQQAKETLAVWVKSLQEKGIQRPDFKKNPKWRNLNAQCNKVKRRIERVAEIEVNNAEVAQRKAEILAAVQ